MNYPCIVRLSGLLVAGAFVLASPLAGQDTEWNRYTLEDLPGVFLRTEANPSCERAGVSAASVAERAESALREAEVGLLTESDMFDTPGLPDLRITVECVEGPDDTMAYSVWVRMQQAARMIRDPQIQLSEAVTWYASAMGVGDASRAARAVEEALNAKLAEFAEAFIAANTAEAEEPG